MAISNRKIRIFLFFKCVQKIPVSFHFHYPFLVQHFTTSCFDYYYSSQSLSFNKYGLSSYHELGTVIGAGDTMMKKDKQFPPISTILHAIFILKFLKRFFLKKLFHCSRIYNSLLSYSNKFKFLYLDVETYHHLISPYVGRIFPLFHSILSCLLETSFFTIPPTLKIC